MCETCKYCGDGLNSTTIVRLWDGRDYCELCVDSVLPGLAEYAHENPVLKESTAYSFSRLCQTMAFSLPVGALPVPVLAICVFGLFLPAESLIEYLFIQAYFFAMFYVYALAFFFLFSPIVIAIAWSQHPRSIEVQNGELAALNCWGWRVARALALPARLDEIQWSNGTTLGDHFVGWSWPRKPCLVIHAHILQAFFRTGLTCGMTNTTRERWLAFFKLSGVRELGQGENTKMNPNCDNSEHET